MSVLVYSKYVSRVMIISLGISQFHRGLVFVGENGQSFLHK